MVKKKKSFIFIFYLFYLANAGTSTAIATHILLAFHMLFVNILLINLLIAMFSFTFQTVQVHTDLVWRYERYSLIREYFDRPPLFPPLIIITHLIDLMKFIIRHSSKRTNTTQVKTFSKFLEIRNNLYII
jgi:hypothetical protein